MSRLLRMVADLGRDSITFNPLFTNNTGLIPILPGYTLPGSLTVKLANRCDEVEVEGQATFVLTPTTLTLTSEAYGVQIDIYANGVLAYTTKSILTGLAIAPAIEYIWTVPIRFEESPALTIVQDTVVYTAIISRIAGVGFNSTNGTIEVIQGSIEAEEVASDFNCFPGCGSIPRVKTP